VHRKVQAQVRGGAGGKGLKGTSLAAYSTPFVRITPLGHGYVRFKHWRLYGERGLAGEDVSVWVYEGNLKVEYQATALSLYELSIEKKTGDITEVKNPRRLETHFRSPQLDLSEVQHENEGV